MSAWTTWVCDTQTGVKQLEVTPATQSWGRKLNAGGSGTSMFQLSASDGIPWRSLIVNWAREIVVCRNGTPVYVGIITDSDYDETTQQLTVTHADIRAILGKRYPFGVNSYWSNPPTDTIPGQLVCTNLTWRAIASAVVGAGLVGPYPIYSLPIVLPSATEAGTASMTFPNYNFLSVADALTQIQTLGCDVDFNPSWSGSNTLQWTMRTGTPTVPAMTGNSFEFNQSSPLPPLTTVKLKTSGAKQLTGQFTVGTGAEQDMIVGGVGLGSSATIPALDIVDNQKTATTAPEAAAFSSAALAAYASPTKQWSFQMQAGDAAAPVENLLLGSSLNIFFHGDPWIPDGKSTVRLIGLAGDLTEIITPTVQ